MLQVRTNSLYFEVLSVNTTAPTGRGISQIVPWNLAKFAAENGCPDSQYGLSIVVACQLLLSVSFVLHQLMLIMT